MASVTVGFERNALSPASAGFHLEGEQWIKEIEGIGLVAIAELDWRHSQLPSFTGYGDDRRDLDALALLVELQRQTWGMAPEDLAPVNLLAVVADTGGAILVAYEVKRGFNAEGWLGFVFGLGSRSGVLVSHMLGVRPDARGAAGIGWALKLAQADAARRTGHHAMNWTFDPMRGGNARLNLEKLGAAVEEMTIDKYGVLTTALYGDVPSDRFISHWNLTSPAVERKVLAAARRRASSALDAALGLPILTPNSLSELAARKPPRMVYEIPGDIDLLSRVEPQRAILWRAEARALLSTFITTNRAVPVDDWLDPGSIRIETTVGDYIIDGFASEARESGRRSFYLLTRKAPDEDRVD